MRDLEQRLRRALQDTDESPPRPIANLELPFGTERLLGPAMVRRMRPAAVLAPVIRRGDELSMLLTLRAAHLRAHQGQVSFPGGRRDEGDGSAAANALREAQEEVGLPPDRVEVLGYLDDYPTITNFRVTPVVGLIVGDFELQPDPGEVAEVFEVPMSLVLDPKAYRRRKLSRDGLVVPYRELKWDSHRVWGATAGMLWNLCQRVQQHG